MKYNHLLGLFFVTFMLFYSTFCASAPSLKGIIESLSLTGNVPQYTIFYDGKQTFNDRDGFFLLPAHDTQAPLNILICKKIIESFQTANNIKHFYVSKTESYKFYAQINKKDQKITESKLSEDNKIPQNTIIISMDPDHIQTITHWDISLPGELIKLPKITLRSDLSSQELERSAVECTLCALDVARWHEKFPSTQIKSLA